MPQGMDSRLRDLSPKIYKGLDSVNNPSQQGSTDQKEILPYIWFSLGERRPVPDLLILNCSIINLHCFKSLSLQ